MAKRRTSSVILPPPPPAPPTFHDKLSGGYYETKLPYGDRNSAEREAHGADERRLNDEFVADLAVEDGTDKLPEAIRDRVYSMANEEGHGSGKSEVVYYHGLFSELAILAYEAGKGFGGGE